MVCLPHIETVMEREHHMLRFSLPMRDYIQLFFLTVINLLADLQKVRNTII